MSLRTWAVFLGTGCAFISNVIVVEVAGKGFWPQVAGYTVAILVPTNAMLWLLRKANHQTVGQDE